MKINNILILAFLVFNFTFLYSQTENKHKYVEFHEDNKTKKIEGTLSSKGRDGIWSWFSKNGNLILSGKYINDIKEGKWQEFYDSGKLRNFKIYKNGLITGTEKSFFENGKILADSEYVNGKINGISTVYYQNGNIKEKINYKNGKPIGNYISYFDNKVISSEGKYSENGEKKGLWQFYRIDKTIFETIEYFPENKFHEKYFDVNGNIIETKTNKK